MSHPDKGGMIRRLRDYFKRRPHVHHHYHVVPRSVVKKLAEESSAHGPALREAQENQRRLAREEAAERAKRREEGTP
jgi:hypothetical protein